MSGLTGRALERFWSKVAKTPDCWIWQAGRYGTGVGAYGCFWVDGGHVRAHRLSWELAYGPIPEGISVLHRCDNPPCVNPDHLWLGTDADNSHDMVAKGRSSSSRKTSCPKGHEYNPENTLVTGRCRYCRICRKERTRLWLADPAWRERRNARQRATRQREKERANQ